MDFMGIPDETLSFLSELRENNNKDWFDENRSRYLNDFLEVAKTLVVTMGEELAKEFPTIQAIPKVNKSIFRLNRDARYNSGLPYKTWIGVRFWIGQGHPNSCPGFYLQVQPEDIKLGAGMFQMNGEGLNKFRTIVNDHGTALQLEEIISPLEEDGFQILREAHNQVPQGFSKEEPEARFLRHVGLFGSKTIPMTTENRGKKLVTSSMGEFKKGGDLVRWMVENL